MICITGPSLALVMFTAATFLKRGAICKSCKRVNGRWTVTVAFTPAAPAYSL